MTTAIWADGEPLSKSVFLWQWQRCCLKIHPRTDTPCAIKLFLTLFKILMIAPPNCYESEKTGPFPGILRDRTRVDRLAPRPNAKQRCKFRMIPETMIPYSLQESALKFRIRIPDYLWKTGGFPILNCGYGLPSLVKCQSNIPSLLPWLLLHMSVIEQYDALYIFEQLLKIKIKWSSNSFSHFNNLEKI